MGRYVGARYAPLFDGQHDSTKAYEPLTVVYDQGNSYCSKKYVPVGIAITNSEYWVLVGNFNQQMADLQNSYNSLSGRADDLESRADGFDTQLEGVADDIEALQETTAGLGTSKLSTTALKDMFVIDRKVIELTIAAGTTSSGTANIEKSGHTPIGIAGWTVSIFELKEVTIGAVGAINVGYSLTNPRDTSQSGQLVVFVLYVKNS